MPDLKMKWAVWNEIRRILISPFLRLYFNGQGISWNTGWRILGAPIIQKAKDSRIVLGDRLVLRSWATSNPVAPYHRVFLSTRKPGAEIILGDGVGITGGSIIAAERVEM